MSKATSGVTLMLPGYGPLHFERGHSGGCTIFTPAGDPIQLDRRAASDVMRLINAFSSPNPDLVEIAVASMLEQSGTDIHIFGQDQQADPGGLPPTMPYYHAGGFIPVVTYPNPRVPIFNMQPPSNPPPGFITKTPNQRYGHGDLDEPPTPENAPHS